MMNLKKLFKLANERNLDLIQQAQKSLLIAMERSKDSGILKNEVLKRGKAFKIEFEQEIRGTVIKLNGLIDVGEQGDVYDPYFDLKAEIYKKKGFIRKQEVKEAEYEIKGKYPSLEIISIDGKENIKHKKIIAVACNVAYIYSVLKPIAEEYLGVALK